MTCGSVWACPLCAAVIQEQRRKELIRVVAWAYHSGLQAAMVTLTFPHQVDDSLADLLERQALALRLFRKGRAWSRLKEFSRYQGHIRSLELTHGENGWHPHTHELFFITADVDELRFLQELQEQWESACVRAGLLDLNNLRQVLGFRDIAVDVRFNCKDSDYIAKQDDSRKWGIDHEVAKASTKVGRSSGIHPHGLLVRAGTGDRRAGDLFLEFIQAMHGKRQLVWSPRLKARCGLDDVSDDEIVEHVDQDEILLCLIDPGNWSRVQRKLARRKLTEIGEKALLAGGPDAAKAAIALFLSQLYGRERR
ncbi:Replication protein [compost metagenome]